MAQQTINIGASPNDGTGTPLRTAFQYTNSNFSELYTAVGPSGNNIVVPGNATITGDLTVDTNVLKVDSAGNRVIIGATTVPDTFLKTYTTDGTVGIGVGFSASAGYQGTWTNHPYVLAANGAEQLRIAPLGVFTFGDGAGGTRMTLNSTGLGVGVSPDFKFAVNGTQAVPDTTGSSTTNGSLRIGAPGTGLVIDTGVTAAAAVYGWIQARARTDYSSNFNLVLQPNGGNVGIGVTPSAWVAGAKALQFGAYGSLAQSSSGNIELSFNSYNSGAGAYKYLQTDTASLYRASSVHSWFVAPSGTAGNVITYTQAMTLDASGRLILLASTTTPATLSTNGQLTFTATSDTNLRFSYRGSDGVTRTADLTLA